MLAPFIQKLKTTSSGLYFTYLLVYIPFGFAMNAFGEWAEIAKFTYWWQVFTCYGLYMIPISILLRGRSFFDQYAYGLVAMGILEFLGYALQTSYAYPNSILDQFFNPQNFALGMALFFAVYFPLGNWAVNTIYKQLLRKKIA
ncbi:MAG: hypothetical protein ACI849_000530 [Patiriisocius sp.]|jgi:hypothetical protein